MHHVYILKCNDGGIYVGCTDNIRERLKRHVDGFVPATKCRLPIKLSCFISAANKYTAFNLERYLKSGSGRAFIKRHLKI